MKYLKTDEAGNIVSIINSNSFDQPPAGYFAFETEINDLDLIEIFYINNGLLKKREKRPSLNHVWDLTAEVWSLNMAQLKINKSKDIYESCRSSIVSGFLSDALGDPYHYPSKTIDQQNLAASVLASYDPENAPDWTTPFWCADADGEWAFRPHTAAQIREVGRDAKSAILGYQFHNEQLQAAIAAASTAEQLDTINW